MIVKYLKVPKKKSKSPKLQISQLKLLLNHLLYHIKITRSIKQKGNLTQESSLRILVSLQILVLMLVVSEQGVDNEGDAMNTFKDTLTFQVNTCMNKVVVIIYENSVNLIVLKCFIYIYSTLGSKTIKEILNNKKCPF